MASAKLHQYSSTRRLTALYIASLGSVALMLLSGQMLVQRMLSQQTQALRVVSAAQRQQLLCQQMSKAALSLRISDPSERPEKLAELRSALTAWGTVRDEITAELADAAAQDPDIAQALAQLKPAAQGMVSTSKNLLALETERSPNERRMAPRMVSTMTAMRVYERDFMSGMDALILKYTQKASLGVDQLRQLEFGLLVAALLTLGLEGLFIFRPAVRKIREALTALAASLKATQETADQLAIAKNQSEQLLLNILPEPIAERLKQDQGAIADGFAEATVLFADIVGFTQLASRLSPQELVQLLNRIFSRFDQLAERFHLEKIKTIGDAYMVVGGLPHPRPDHAALIAEMALAMQAAIAQFNQETGQTFRMRMGINTGPVVAGVIGLKKFIYDLWGDTVNTASRMESHGETGHVNISEATYLRIKDDPAFSFIPRGRLHVKGKGEMPMYFVVPA